ncbi:transposase, partial [Gordonia sihwensis]
METGLTGRDTCFVPRPPKYSPELRDRATRMAIDARKDPETAPGALARIAKQLDVNPETLRTWVRRVEDGQAEAPGSRQFQISSGSACWRGKFESCVGRTRWRIQAV